MAIGTKLVAGNWKMNGLRADGAVLARGLAERAVAVGVTLSLRAGLAGGPVILFEGDDYIGGPVNLAARLCDAARPRELLAAADLADAVPPWAAAVAVGARDISGFPVAVEVVRIEPAVAAPVATGR